MAGMQVIGTSAADEAIRAIARRGTRQAVVQWAERVIRRHVRREPSLLTRVKDAKRLEAAMEADGIPDEARARIRTAFKAGEPVYTVSAQALSRFLSKASDTMDWIESLTESDRRIRRIQFMAWAEAERLAEAWHASLARARKVSRRIMDGARKIADLGGGEAFAAELTTKGSLSAEGWAMGHCVGGYWHRVEDGSTKIVSIRDADGHPHVTIELRRPSVIEFADGGAMKVCHAPGPGASTVVKAASEWVAVQIRGKQNRVPVPRYMGFVREWLDKAGVPWVEYGVTSPSAKDGIRVYSVYDRIFRSPDAASAYAEEHFLTGGGKGTFLSRYLGSGLKSIHAEASPDVFGKFLAAVLPGVVTDFTRRLESGHSLVAAARESGLSTVLAERGSLKDPSILSIVYDMACASDPEAASREESVLVEVPGGEPLRLVVHTLPLMPLVLLSSGYAPGMEERAAADLTPVLRAVADDIASDPCAIHFVRGVTPVPEADVRGGFLFCGLAREIAAATAAAETALGEWVREARLALERARRSGRYPREKLNAASNMLADGYGARIHSHARSVARADGFMISVPERKAAAPVIRRQEEPAIKSYSLPR